jgi:hypothetical protein
VSVLPVLAHWNTPAVPLTAAKSLLASHAISHVMPGASVAPQLPAITGYVAGGMVQSAGVRGPGMTC